MVNKADYSIAEDVLKKARASPRKRSIYCFHDSPRGLQRMINAGLSDTYCPPHKHENPDKLEIFSIVKGKVAILVYNNDGKVSESFILDENGPLKAVEVLPGTWHNFVVISKEAAVYEIKEGDYNPETDKNFAPWAPKEEEKEKAKKYLESLKNEIKRLSG